MKRVSRLQSFAWLILAAIGTAVAVVPSASYANGILAAYPATFEVLAAGGTTIFTPGTVSGNAVNSGFEGGSEFSTASASYADGNGAVSGHGYSSGGADSAVSRGIAGVEIYFEVVGSAPGVTTVPLIFSATAATTASSGAGGDASATAGFDLSGYFADTACDGYDCDSLLYPSSFNGSVTEDLYPNVVYAPSIYAEGSAGLGNGTWFASLDPMIEIAPSFTDASDFTLEFSPNPPISPISGVPEPSSLLMFGTALLALMGLKLSGAARHPRLGSILLIKRGNRLSHVAHAEGGTQVTEDAKMPNSAEDQLYVSG